MLIKQQGVVEGKLQMVVFTQGLLDDCKAMGCRIGVSLVLGEVGVARVNPYQSGPGEPPVQLAWIAPRLSAAATQLRVATGGLSFTWWTTSTRPG